MTRRSPFTGDAADPIYDFDFAVARVSAAAKVAHGLPVPFLLTARAENLLHGRNDLPDTIRRLQAYEAAGADVLYAPGCATWRKCTKWSRHRSDPSM